MVGRMVLCSAVSPFIAKSSPLLFLLSYSKPLLLRSKRLDPLHGHAKYPGLSTAFLPCRRFERVCMNHKKLAVLALLVVAVSQSSLGQGKPSVAVSDELVAAETEMFAKI